MTPILSKGLTESTEISFSTKIGRQTPLCPCEVLSYSQEIFLFALAKIFSSSTHSHVIETYVSFLLAFFLWFQFAKPSHPTTNPALIECPSPNWIQYFRCSEKELREEWYYLLFLTQCCLTNITLEAMLHHQLIKNIVNKDPHI